MIMLTYLVVIVFLIMAFTIALNMLENDKIAMFLGKFLAVMVAGVKLAFSGFTGLIMLLPALSFVIVAGIFYIPKILLARK